MFKNKKKSANVWMSFSDLLTGALVVFMLITVVLVIQTRGKIKEIEDQSKTTAEAIKTDLKGIQGITVTNQGTIRIYSSQAAPYGDLFTKGSDQLTPIFKNILGTAFPVFINEVEKVYLNKEKKGVTIKEIRLEGHTDSDGIDDDNLNLSQRRATNTWLYVRDNFLTSKNTDFQDFVKNHLVTVGFGENQLIGIDTLLVRESGSRENKALSRRVELSVLFKGFNKSE